MSYIIKTDLALNVWKICFDAGKSSNTIPKLVNSVNNRFRDDGSFEYIRMNKKDKSLKKALSAMRNTFIAHLDVEHYNETNKIDSLKNLLMKAIEDFNKVCECNKLLILKEYSIQDAELYKIKTEVSVKLGIMLAR